MQRFASLARTGIPPFLPWLRVTGETDRLRANVLNFELPFLEIRCTKQVRSAQILECIAPGSLAKNATVAQVFSQRPALPWLGAQPEFGLLLQCPQPGRQDIHVLAQPWGHGTLKQFGVREAERFVGKPLNQF